MHAGGGDNSDDAGLFRDHKSRHSEQQDEQRQEQRRCDARGGAKTNTVLAHNRIVAAKLLDRLGDDRRALARLDEHAAGLVDGRALDELTVFLLEDAALAAGALGG